MNKFEKYFIKVHKILDKIKLNHWLVGSSFLGPVRENKLLSGDKEVNFGVDGNELLLKIKDLEKYFKIIYVPSMFKISGIYLVNKGYDENESLWDHPVDFTYLATCFKIGNKLIQTVSGNNILYWSRDLFEPLMPRTFMGLLFLSPNNPNKYFKEYYGDNWKTPIPEWNWQENALNLINIENLL